MSLITIKSITHEQKTSSSGKQYVSCRIKVWNKKEGKDTILSGFGDDVTKTWRAGDEVDVDLSQNDKGYWNFSVNENSLPSADPVVALLKEISAKLDRLLPPKPPENGEVAAGTVMDSQEGEVKVEDIPF